MAAITAAMVKDLRQKTDAPMMECKKALVAAEGDFAKAEEILRVKLGNKANKAAARVAAEGIVGVYVSDDRKLGALFEVNSETDFVAKNPDFVAMAEAGARLVAEKNPADIAALCALTVDGKSLEEIRTARSVRTCPSAALSAWKPRAVSTRTCTVVPRSPLWLT